MISQRTTVLDVLIVVFLAGITVGSLLWPLIASTTSTSPTVPWVVLVFLPLLTLAAATLLARTLVHPRPLALIAVTVVAGTAARFLSLGTFGVELIFFILITAGWVAGVRMGFVLGVVTIVVSAVVTGGLGPWLPFQMLACGWVAAGAGAVAHVTGIRRWAHQAPIQATGISGTRHGWAVPRGTRLALVVYTVIVAYLFGAAMNMWLWPWTIDPSSRLALIPGEPASTNLVRFFRYTLATSTLTWDTVRAIANAMLMASIGPAMVATFSRHFTPRSTLPLGDGTRTRPLTARGEAATRH